MSEFTPPDGHLLGSDVEYPQSYAPELLSPIQRSLSRSQLRSSAPTVFNGEDIWTAYEVSWLSSRGMPQAAMAEIAIPAMSECIIESKSLKLYFNSLNQASFESEEKLLEVITADLSRAAGAPVRIKLVALDDPYLSMISDPEGKLLDKLDIDVCVFEPSPDLLQVDRSSEVVSESVYSNLLKSNCPVTGQPDWATVQISYVGQQIDHEGLLRYIISFRDHQDFHEHCVERMFSDILKQCQPDQLRVYARYTRRGGLDINPYRTTGNEPAPRVRWVRQ